ncbi:uncharacterized protein LOC129762896 [Toxorhynchites rutilus septentrionalis]|uniref:uncharacterized protein LOC129762896 n=1 Tax=Toxorhynchites rutilus septentrionalis TaxID=329112 RepID=UPI00247ACB99|nr:uncharacterized protein LOC129762896 [Toxorhynchites rutilus septentrionalis]
MLTRFCVIVLALLVAVLATAETQSADAAGPAAGPTLEQVVQQRVANTLNVLNLIAANSVAPPEVKEAVLANAQQELDSCVEQVSVHGNQGYFFACTGIVIKNAANALNGNASSGAAPAK